MAFAFEAGCKNALVASGAYPMGFGMAMASLLPATGQRPASDFYPVPVYTGIDHLGSLDDFVKGRRNAWWKWN